MAHKNKNYIENIELSDMPSHVKFKVEESYKTIRTNIMLSIMKKGCKTIVISSSSAGEGKTTTAINLAISMAEAKQKVLLIDGDLRKPKIHHFFALPSIPGITNYLSSSVTNSESIPLSSIIKKTNKENLYLAPCGTIPPNPAEILSSNEMQELLKKLGESFDYIIIDTSPLALVSDALPIIKESDGAVIIVKQKESSHPVLAKTLAALELVDAKVLGFVMNFSEESKNHKKYYKKYNYYYQYEYKEKTK